MRSKDLPQYLVSRQALEVHDPRFVSRFLSKISEESKRWEVTSIEEFRNDIAEAVATLIGRKSGVAAESGRREYKYLPVRLTKCGEASIAIETAPSSILRGGPLEEGDWSGKVEKMNDFLANRSTKEIGDVGLAIGVQNCLFDGGSVYVGVRMKAEVDANATSICVAKGIFNTGYQLLREPKQKLRLESERTLHDLFVMRSDWLKHLVEPDTSIYKIMEKRLKALDYVLWKIKLNDRKEYPATVFLNNSRWYPRFEVGIWKYVDIGSLVDTDMVHGFGEDLYQEYRSQRNNELLNINYWIWVKDGEVFYWSFPEERFVPRFNPTENSEAKHSVLVSTRRMMEVYEKNERFTPFASDELLEPRAVIQDYFSSPARALLQCF